MEPTVVPTVQTVITALPPAVETVPIPLQIVLIICCVVLFVVSLATQILWNHVEFLRSRVIALESGETACAECGEVSNSPRHQIPYTDSKVHTYRPFDHVSRVEPKQ